MGQDNLRRELGFWDALTIGAGTMIGAGIFLLAGVAQVLAAVACLGIIVASGPFAQVAVVVLIVASLAWYVVWGRGRVEIEHAVPDFKARWAEGGWSAVTRTPVAYAEAEPSVVQPLPRTLSTADPRRVAVALANPKHEADLLRLGRTIATGRYEGGHVAGIHLVRVPLQTPLNIARERFTERPSLERAIAEGGGLGGEASGDGAPTGQRPIDQTTVEARIDVAHDVFAGLIGEAAAQRADLLLMGWQGGFNVSRIYHSPIQRLMTGLPADLAVLKHRGLDRVDRVLLPWGGGLHAHLGLEIAIRIARMSGAEVHLLRVVRPEVAADREQEDVARTVAGLVGDFERIEYLVREADSVTEGIRACMEAADYDLVIIGASREWTIRNVLFGSIPDIIADQAGCSVLMVRRYVADTLTAKAAQGFKRLKELVGMTTSPESGTPRR